MDVKWPVRTGLPGQQFGRLTILAEAPRRNGKRYVQTRCACGTVKEIAVTALVQGDTQSCGCFHVERTVATSTTHGHAPRAQHTPEYRCWKALRNRCNNPKSPDYPNYGGRGIGICPEWQHDFLRFFADMGQKPSPAHMIERIDNDGPYAPWNCKWATRSEQMRNRRPWAQWKRAS